MKNNVHLIKERFDQFRQIKTKMNTRKKKIILICIFYYVESNYKYAK